MEYALINEKMQEGYKLYMERQDAAACDVWMETWRKIVEAMNLGGYAFLEDFEPVFDGIQRFANWANDFEVALINASHQNKSYVNMRILFFTEYYARSRIRNNENALYMRRGIAEAHFQLGEADVGDQMFQELTDEFPMWSWGWIGWADQYGLYGDEAHQDLEKAISILKLALYAEELDARYDVLERLRDLYAATQRTEEAQQIEEEMEKEEQRIAEQEAARKGKIGRNELCPCGSGKKYKKCHGAGF